MAIHYNVKTVTDGLVLALDAANPKSYSGSGTTWTDLSGNGNTGTLVGGVGYNATNGGSIVFDGSNDYIQTNFNYSLTSSTTEFTCAAWCKCFPEANSEALIFSNYETTPVPFNLYPNLSGKVQGFTRNSGGSSVSVISLTSVNDSRWHYVVYTKTGSNTYKLYVDGNLEATATASLGAISVSNTIVLGVLNYYFNQGRYRGDIAVAQIYNRALSAAEVSQNYNALKSRYISAPSIPTPTLPILGPNYEQLTYIVSGNLTATGNGTTSVDIFKTSGSGAWDNQAYSTTAFSAPCTIEFNKQAASTDNTVSYAMIGWNEDPTANASYNTLDYTSYPYQTNNYEVYHNASLVQSGGTWNTANKLYVVYGTDGFIRHYNGSTLLYSVNYGTGRTVYVDSSFYSVNSTFGGFSNIKVIRSAWNGVSYA